MRIFKKIIIFVFTSFLVVIIGGLIYIDIKLPDLPPLTNKIIDNALKKNSYSLKGEQGYALNDDTKIWYESISPEDTIHDNIVLIMGIANDALAWPYYFIDSLVNKGYRVIRYDNRGTGMSDWMTDWSSEQPYSLDDMANDVIAIVDTLEIERFHVVGVSLGGMIAQTVSIRFPKRVRTLTSIMSTGDIMDESLPPINKGTITDLMLAQIKYGIVNSESNQIKLQYTTRLILMGDSLYTPDLESIAESVLYNIRSRNGFNTNASKQQITATMESGSRYDELSKLKVPALVIHGTTDPLIDIKHGIKTFETIPNANKIWIKGMGHDIPKMFSDSIVEAINTHIQNNTSSNE